jgi:predicted RNase H-like HicB family nuclease
MPALQGDKGMSHHMREHVYRVRAEWDSEAKVWYISDTDVPGLVAEAENPEKLLELLSTLIPELVALNGEGDGGAGEIPYSVMLDHLSAQRLVEA